MQSRNVDLLQLGIFSVPVPSLLCLVNMRAVWTFAEKLRGGAVGIYICLS